MKCFNYLVMTLMAICLGCSRHDEYISSVFRWSPLCEESDSIVVRLEKGFISDIPSDSLLFLSGQLERLSAGTDNRQILCRYYYWRGRIEMRMLRDATESLQMAAQLCDSARFPYDMMRIRYLQAVREGAKDVVGYYRMLKGFEDATLSENDSFIRASVLVNLGNLLLESGSAEAALRYYKTADSLYRELGIAPYVLKNGLNIVNVLYDTGHSDEGLRLLEELHNSPHAVSDTVFYANLCITTYVKIGDSDALQKGYSVLQQRFGRKSVMLNYIYDVLFCRDAIGKGDYSRADSLLMRLKEYKVTPQIERYSNDFYKTALQLYEAQGIRDSSLRYSKLLAEGLSEELDAQTAAHFGAIENQMKIMHFKQDAENRARTMRMWLFGGILLTVIAGLLVSIWFMRRQQRQRLSLLQTRLVLERSQREMVSTSLAMTEKDNLLESVLEKIVSMTEQGCLAGEDLIRMEQCIKLHLSGRQDWEDFQRMFREVYPLKSATKFLRGANRL